MALSAGTRLGPYEILSAIGAGGMGEVYKACDTRLNRTVAIKVLPEHRSSTPQARERFDREAKAVSSLSHPHICPLYDIGHQDGIDYLVMEYLEGQTMADRLRKGPLPLDRVLRYAIEIVDALDQAHRHGIIHRDLKPGNIMVTKSGIKLLDFGLAKLQTADPGAAATVLPTETAALTAEGAILGTLQYMAPEQLEGKEADARTDLFAMGEVIYEMVSGRKAFEGTSQASLIVAILERDSPSVASVAPAAFDRALRRCLAKDPDDRWQSARDLKAELEWISEGGTGAAAADAPTRRPWREWAGWIAAAALALLVGIGWLWLWRTPLHVDRPLVRLNVDLGPDAVSGPGATTVLSPDGDRLIFLAHDLDGKPCLAMRLLNQSQTTLLAGTENAQNPFFSPNGQWLGFFADSKMKKVSVQGGAPVVLGGDFGNGRGASWDEDDTIIVSPNPVSGLLRLAATGGTARQLKGTMFCYWPQILPGGQAVLVTRATGNDTANVEVVSLQTGDTKVVAPGGYHGRYLPSGHVVFVHDRVLFGVPFDLGRLEASGAPVPLLDDVADDDRIVSDRWGNPTFAAGKFDFARNGSLIYLSGRPMNPARTLIWMDRSGNTQPLPVTLNRYSHPRLSPDGNHLAVAAGSNIWVVNLQRNTPLRLTYRTTFNQQPEWSPDGQHLVYGGRSGSSFGLWWVRADGAGAPQQLLESQPFVAPSSISTDGSRIAFHKWTAERGWEVWILPIDASDPDHPKPGLPQRFLAGAFAASFSPNGRWIAYGSSESGSGGVFVRPFSGQGGPWQIDNSDVPIPRWSRDGRTLYYLSTGHGLMEVAYSATKAAFEAEKPRAWSARSGMGKVMDFALTPDGKRAIAVVEPEVPSVQESNVQVTFLLNFFDELRRRAPAAGK